jgi:cold shock CspA family protein
MVIAAIFIIITITITIIIYRRFVVVDAHQQCVVVDGLFVDASNVNVSERSIPGLDAILRDQLPAAPIEAVVIGSTSGPSNRKAIWTQLGYSAHFSERSPGQGEAFVDDALVAHMQRVILSAKPGANLSRHLIVLATGDGGENDGRPSFKSAVEGALKAGFNVKLICYRPNPVYRRFAAEFPSQLQIVEINRAMVEARARALSGVSDPPSVAAPLAPRQRRAPVQQRPAVPGAAPTCTPVPVQSAPIPAPRPAARPTPLSACPSRTMTTLLSRVKWFDHDKGFGCAAPNDPGHPDVFLTDAALRAAGVVNPRRGTSLMVTFDASHLRPRASAVRQPAARAA